MNCANCGRELTSPGTPCPACSGGLASAENLSRGDSSTAVSAVVIVVVIGSVLLMLFLFLHGGSQESQGVWLGIVLAVVSVAVVVLAFRNAENRKRIAELEARLNKLERDLATPPNP